MSDAERRRLLYVACTRAVDHLVVSLYRPPPAKGNPEGTDRGKLTSAELLWYAGAAGPTSGARLGGVERRPVDRPTATALELDWSDPEGWAGQRLRVLAAGVPAVGDRCRSPRRRVASARADGRTHRRCGARQAAGQRRAAALATGAVRHEHRPGRARRAAVLRPRRRSRRRHARPVAVRGRGRHRARGARRGARRGSALRTPIVRSVVAGDEHWRELFVAATVGGRVLEGYVDLLVRAPGGLVIVDYKTDQWSGPLQTAERLDRYRLQLAAYGAALESALGEPISGGILVRCVAGGDAEQIVVDRWGRRGPGGPSARSADRRRPAGGDGSEPHDDRAPASPRRGRAGRRLCRRGRWPSAGARARPVRRTRSRPVRPAWRGGPADRRTAGS